MVSSVTRAGDPTSAVDVLTAAPGRARPLLFASITVRHFTQGRAKAAHSAWRLLPRRARTLLVGPVGRVFPVAAVIGQHTLGHRQAARTQLTQLGRGRRVFAAAEAAMACGELDVARALLDGRDDTPGLTRARLLRAGGYLGEALLAARSAGRLNGRLLADELAGEIAALTPQDRTDLARAPEFSRRAPSAPGTTHLRPRPLRVLHVVSNSWPEAQAGYTARTAGIVAGQHKVGLDPHVVTRLGFPVDTGVLSTSARVEIGGTWHHRLLPTALPRRKDRGIAEAERRLTELVARLRPDVIHAHSKHENAQIALAVAAEQAIPVVYEVRGMLEETWRSRGGDPGSDFYRLTREAETWCMRHASRVLTLGVGMAEEIVGRGLPADQVVITPNAVDHRFLEAPPAVQAREQLGLAPAELVIGVAGTLNDYEGVDVLLRAFAEAEIPEARVLVVGDGPAATELRHLGTRLGAPVEFTGRVPPDAVPLHLAAMDLFCVPRLPTPVTSLVSPLKPVEAMAVGLPLLVSDLPPLTELLAGGAHGWEAPAGDVTRWAAALRTLSQDRRALVQARRAAARWVAATRTWDVLALQHAGIYAEVVEERR